MLFYFLNPGQTSRWASRLQVFPEFFQKRRVQRFHDQTPPHARFHPEGINIRVFVSLHACMGAAPAVRTDVQLHSLAQRGLLHIFGSVRDQRTFQHRARKPPHPQLRITASSGALQMNRIAHMRPADGLGHAINRAGRHEMKYAIGQQRISQQRQAAIDAGLVKNRQVNLMIFSPRKEVGLGRCAVANQIGLVWQRYASKAWHG